jgi:hypothetical protein
VLRQPAGAAAIMAAEGLQRVEAPMLRAGGGRTALITAIPSLFLRKDCLRVSSQDRRTPQCTSRPTRPRGNTTQPLLPAGRSEQSCRRLPPLLPCCAAGRSCSCGTGSQTCSCLAEEDPGLEGAGTVPTEVLQAPEPRGNRSSSCRRSPPVVCFASYNACGAARHLQRYGR